MRVIYIEDLFSSGKLVAYFINDAGVVEQYSEARGSSIFFQSFKSMEDIITHLKGTPSEILWDTGTDPLLPTRTSGSPAACTCPIVDLMAYGCSCGGI